MTQDFYTEHEKKITQQFLKNKYMITPAEDMDALHAIRHKVAHAAAHAINHTLKNQAEIEVFLNNIHQFVSTQELNDFRLKIITEINQDPVFRQAYFKVGRQILATLAGNELAMQRRINLSVQMPNDDSSLLPLHADTWADDSPFEIVLWIPLVNCYGTKSMYITNSMADAKIQQNFSQFKNKSSEDIFQTIKNDTEFLEVPFGKVLFFSQNVMHGNRVNTENETRWSMNCRFKSILTPYHGKKMGEFFEPITLRPVTRLGLDYQLPTGFYET